MASVEVDARRATHGSVLGTMIFGATRARTARPALDVPRSSGGRHTKPALESRPSGMTVARPADVDAVRDSFGREICMQVTDEEFMHV